MLTMLTELTSNVATANAVIPTVLALAAPLDMDPRMLFVPATLACSCSFMLPVGTPPNGIVFSTGRIPLRQMAIEGLWSIAFGNGAVDSARGCAFGLIPRHLPKYRRRSAQWRQRWGCRAGRAPVDLDASPSFLTLRRGVADARMQ